MFVFFVPVQVWCTLKFKTFVFLSLCRFGALWSLQCLFFLSVCRFRALSSSKPNALLHVYCDIISIVRKLLCLYLHFWFPMQLFEGSGTFFMQRVGNLKINLTLFKNTFCFQDIVFFFILKCQYISRSYALRMFFLLVFAVLLNMWSYSWYSYLVWWPPPQELELALGRGPYIYMGVYMHLYLMVLSTYPQIPQTFPNPQKEKIPLRTIEGSGVCFRGMWVRSCIYTMEIHPGEVDSDCWYSCYSAVLAGRTLECWYFPSQPLAVAAAWTFDAVWAAHLAACSSISRCHQYMLKGKIAILATKLEAIDFRRKECAQRKSLPPELAACKPLGFSIQFWVLSSLDKWIDLDSSELGRENFIRDGINSETKRDG